MIREVIVVEGKEDIRAIKEAVNAEVLSTGGFGYNRKFVKTLKNINEKRGLIIFTDPDFEGERIRRRLSKELKGVKHAFLSQNKAIARGDIGIENASREDIIEAISKAKPLMTEEVEEFDRGELLDLGFIGGKNSRERRDQLCDILGIGYCNSKQLLNRLNNFGIKRDEFDRAVERID